MPKLTKRFVDTIEAPTSKSEEFYWDEGPGSVELFGIRIKRSGTASYIVQYRNLEGRTRRMALGRVGTLTPDEARVLAKRRLAEVASGEDPSAARKQLRSGMTVKELCELYLETSKGMIRESTLRQDKSRIESHVTPLLGFRAVSGITPADLRKMQQDIASGKTAAKQRPDGRGGMRQGGKGVAARTLGMMGAILELAKQHGAIEINPARGIKKFKDMPRKRPLKAEEVMALGQAMIELEAEGDNKTGFDALRLMLLTGFRREEVLSLPWEWVDLNDRCIRFKQTKSGPQMRPLGSAAVRLIKSRPRYDDAGNELPYVFMSDKTGNHLVGIRKISIRAMEKAEIEGARIHDIRHTFSSTAAEMNYSELVIAGIIGQKVKGVTARYSHVPDAALLLAADRISERIDALLRGEKVSADVVNLREIHHVG